MGADDTVAEDKVAVDKIILVVGGAVVAAVKCKVGSPAVEIIIITVGLFMSRVAAENVPEDSIVVVTVLSSDSCSTSASLISFNEALTISSYDNT